jgi:hypothetical protein
MSDLEQLDGLLRGGRDQSIFTERSIFIFQKLPTGVRQWPMSGPWFYADDGRAIFLRSERPVDGEFC